jgi:hypothetical protein
MNRISKIGVIFLASAGFMLAESWTGKLIDGNCKAESGAKDLPDSCNVTPSTKVFAIQTLDGKVYRLDNAGNAKAAAAVKTDPTKTSVTISGSMDGQMVKVDSINVQ